MIPKDTYYGIPAISNSSLKYINPEEGGSPNKFKDFLDKNLKEDSKSHLIKGTLIHMSILEPERFVICDVMKPPAALGEIADSIITMNLDLDPEDVNILERIRAHNWQNNWGDATVVKKFKEAGGVEYVEYMNNIRNEGKIGMDQNMGKTVLACKTSILMDERCKQLLLEIEEEDNIVAYNEQEVFWEQHIGGQTLKFKAKLDRLIVDHKSKTFWVVDVKTTGNPIAEFKDSFEKYNYDRQMRFYKKAASVLLEQMGHKGYKFDKAYIIAVETSNYHTAQVFDVTRYVTMKSSKLKNLIDRIVFHYNENDWTHSMEHIEGQGIIEL